MFYFKFFFNWKRGRYVFDSNSIDDSFAGINSWTVSYLFDVFKSRCQRARDYIHKKMFDIVQWSAYELKDNKRLLEIFHHVYSILFQRFHLRTKAMY